MNKAMTVEHKHWAMFTKAGNQRINTLANRLSDKAVALLDQFGDSRKFHTSFVNSIRSFLRQYRGMSKWESYREASDTAVREEIWVFLVNLTGPYEVYMDELEEIWNDSRSYPHTPTLCELARVEGRDV